jgi:hypothetical protein
MVSQYLANWIDGVLAQPKSVLARKYNRAHRSAAMDEVEQLHKSNDLSYPVRQPADLPDGLLDQLAVKLRGSSAESPIWGAVIVHLGQPLPPAIATDLLERRIAFDTLGHSRQVDEVQWKLAEVYPEALLTLAIDRYTLSQYSLADLQAVLTSFRDNDAYRSVLALLAELYEASSPEKEQAYLAAVAQHPDAERLLSAYRLHQREVQARSTSLTPEQAQELLLTGIPGILERLASNPQTPEELLHQLMSPQATRQDRRIGAYARQNLAARHKERTKVEE